MKYLVILALFAFVAARPSDDYSRYEIFEVDDIVGNVRLLGGYTKCFEGLGKCTPEAAHFKKLIPEAMQSSCNKCSEHQRTLIARVIQAIVEKLPEDWKKLNQIHDPEGKYSEDIIKFVDEYAKKEQ
ncbi:ejaculatory bulb-specific protein 3-like [Pararge aegeria]|uniref:ejaculatory bulb-specific protein 3-like n=1 Tax=Pararge aegeria TaxID=116150 RepID=UPI0019D15343|nr:ejaculatory bulb-specific protein 3-like [Pararge aegeria]